MPTLSSSARRVTIARAVVQHFLEDDHLALDLVAGGLHDVQPLVQDQLLAGLEVVRLERGVQVHLHLAALRQDVDGAVFVVREEDAVGRRRRAELVDLLAERRDLLARLVERVDELLVLVERLHELPVGLAQLVLQDHRLLGRVLGLLPEADGLRLERADVGLEVLHLDLVLRETSAVVRVGHREELGQPFHPFGRRGLGSGVGFFSNSFISVRSFLGEPASAAPTPAAPGCAAPSV